MHASDRSAYAPSAIAMAAAVLAACAEAHTPACPPEPGRDAAAPRCAARGADEWAAGPLDGRTVLVPESAHLGPTRRYALLVVLAGDPLVAPGGLAARRTFRLGLTDGTLTPVGYEAITGEWFRARLAALEAEPGLDRLLVCLPLPGGGEIRLVPSRPSAESPDPALFFGQPFAGAVRIVGAGGEPTRLPLWAPDEAQNAGRVCGSRLVLRGGDRFVQCATLHPSASCFFSSSCVGLGDTMSWRCTGRAPDGLAYCEPP